MREHFRDPLANSLAFFAERVELDAGALRIRQARAQRVDFVHESPVLLRGSRLIGAQSRDDVDKKLDLFLESIDRVEIDCTCDRLLCHPYRLTCRGEFCRADCSTMLPLQASMLVLQRGQYAVLGH